jgi:uncharacterized protein (DUF2147 family)
MSRIATVILAGALSLGALPAWAGSMEVGIWIDDTGDGAVDVAPCGPKLCGRIVWLKQPLDKAGKPLIDDLNPAAAKRRQPICGLQVLGGLQKQSDGSWDQGWVYDPKVGESYDLAVQLMDANHLVITGYQGLKLFSKKFTWTRATTSLPACNTTTTTAPAAPAPLAPPAATQAKK